MAALAVLSMFAASLAGEARAAAPSPAPQKLAIVNVSFIFEKYDKVSDLQRKIDADFKLQDEALQLRIKKLADRNKKLDEFVKNTNADSVPENIFDELQLLRKDQYLFNRDRTHYDEEVQKAYTTGMKHILTDIRVAIHTVADLGKFDLVLRSPDADDPDITDNPAEPDKKTYLSVLAPKTVAEIIERFNRNPVLFGAQPTDITRDVLTRLNAEYLKRSSGAGASQK